MDAPATTAAAGVADGQQATTTATPATITTTTPGPSFFAGLPDDLKGLPSLQKFEKADHATVAKSYVELEKKIGERPQGVKPVTADSTPDEVAAYRSAMGVPEKPDGYELGDLPFPEAAMPREEQLRAFTGAAHALHLTQTQVQGILQWYAQDTSQTWNGIEAQRTEQNKATMDGLTRKYGAQAPQLLKMAQLYVERRYGPEGLDALDFGQGGMGSNPLMIEMLIESARLTGQDKAIMAEGGSGLMDAQSAHAKHQALSQQYYRTQDEAEKVRLKTEMERIERLAFSQPPAPAR